MVGGGEVIRLGIRVVLGGGVDGVDLGTDVDVGLGVDVDVIGLGVDVSLGVVLGGERVVCGVRANGLSVCRVVGVEVVGLDVTLWVVVVMVVVELGGGFVVLVVTLSAKVPN